jgi:WD40 repeat protein
LKRIVLLCFFMTLVLGLSGCFGANNEAANNGTANNATEQFSVEYIIQQLRAQDDVTFITQSTDKKYIAYLKGQTEEEFDKPVFLHIWPVGESSPIQSERELFHVAELVWSPNSKYIFADSGTYVIRLGHLFTADAAFVDSFDYYETLFFSPEGNQLIYTGLNENQSEIKNTITIDPNIFDLVLYDLHTKKSTVLFSGTDGTDYLANKWIDEQTIEYIKKDWVLSDESYSTNEAVYQYNLETGENRLIAGRTGKPVDN